MTDDYIDLSMDELEMLRKKMPFTPSVDNLVDAWTTLGIAERRPNGKIRLGKSFFEFNRKSQQIQESLKNLSDLDVIEQFDEHYKLHSYSEPCPVCTKPMDEGLTAHMNESCGGSWKPGYPIRPIRTQPCVECTALFIVVFSRPNVRAAREAYKGTMKEAYQTYMAKRNQT